MSSETEVLVAIHGYSPNGMEDGRKPEIVWRDRIEKGLEVLEKLERLELDIEVAISGAGDYKGKTEAERIHDFAENEYPKFSKNYDVIMEEKSTNTEEDVVELHKIASELDADIVFVVSSRDHVPRVVRDWEQHIDEDEDLVLSAVGSNKTYAKSGKSPFILEAAMYEPFADVLDNLWMVDSNKYEEAAKEVREVLEDYIN